jgi:hypothetical protein
LLWPKPRQQNRVGEMSSDKRIIIALN